jgi:hypothetical protein
MELPWALQSPAWTPQKRDDPPEHRPADAPYANRAFLVAKCMPSMSLVRDPILAVRRKDLGELRESLSIPKQERGFFQTHRMR